jgi:hypothetical protein
MSNSHSAVDTTCLPLRKEKRVAVVAFLLLALFSFGFMFANLRPRSILHSFQLNTVDDRAYDARQAPQVRNQLSSNVLLKKLCYVNYRL